MADEEKKQDVAANEVVAEDAPAAQDRQMRLNFAGITPQYANFCTMAVRQGEVFMNFGKAFVPSNELKIDEQIVMSMNNFKQLHEAMGRMLEAQQG